MRRAVAIAVVAGAVAVARPAAAYPELAARSGHARCNDCHVSPAGGGLLTDWGRSEAADVLGRGGDGGFLHGAVELPPWILLGGDLRGAALAYQDREATEGNTTAIFPMQADVRGAIVAGSVSVVATLGLRGSARAYDEQDAPPWSYVISPEHYAMWRADVVGPYVRGGRFFPIQGLRLPDHTLYVRRHTGTNLYEEPYAVAAGYVAEGWEIDATGFVHDPVLDVGRREAGAAVHGELHRERFAIGTHARAGFGDDGLRVIGGASARVHLPGGVAVALVEADVIHDRIADTEAVTQLAALAGADVLVTQGVQVFAWYEQFQEVVGFAGGLHHGAGVALKLYPRAHWEVIVQGRWQRVGGGATTWLEMLQLHYYL